MCRSISFISVAGEVSSRDSSVSNVCYNAARINRNPDPGVKVEMSS